MGLLTSSLFYFKEDFGLRIGNFGLRIVDFGIRIEMETSDIREILSEREFEVMVLVSGGLYNKEVASELNCEETTVKKHLQHIFPKLEVHNRTEATLKFLRLTGMIMKGNN